MRATELAHQGPHQLASGGGREVKPLSVSVARPVVGGCHGSTEGTGNKSMKVGNKIEMGNAGWNFGGTVPETFVEHVTQSVPFYAEGHDLICQLSDFFCSGESVCYELGASTGELLKKLATHNRNKPDTRWIGIDAEAAMVEKARLHCNEVKNIEIVREDVRAFDYQKADLIVSYYCMQFIAPRDRQALFTRIYESLNWGGAFIMFEKVRGPDARFQDITAALYNDFKLQQGFSAAEIVGKTRSLKGILEPFSSAGNIGLFERAGFTDVMTVMKYVCFEGFLGIK
jgi:tRNA (cmo5U34)-methyltransferase